jgi:hypothetical protein
MAGRRAPRNWKVPLTRRLESPRYWRRTHQARTVQAAIGLIARFSPCQGRHGGSTGDIRLLEHPELMFSEHLLGDLVVFNAQGEHGFALRVRYE